MKIFLGWVQETICGSHLLEQLEERIPQFEAKTDECHRILERIHSIEQVCSRDTSNRRRKMPQV